MIINSRRTRSDIRPTLAALQIVLWAALLTPAESQEVFIEKVLSTNSALTIAQGALAECRAQGYHISVTVIDGNNFVKVAIRDDGTGVGTAEASRRKAFTALNYGRTSAEQVKIWKSTPPPINIPDGAILSAGGVPIKLGDEVIGAVGVSGAPSGKDEPCANAGIAAVSAKPK
jgi:uncharacterized protein GlcG (DUF336 family)